jgi:hypothetical protein
MTTAWIRPTGNCDSYAIIALGFSPVNGASCQGPVFAVPVAPSGAKHHSLWADIGVTGLPLPFLWNVRPKVLRISRP